MNPRAYTIRKVMENIPDLSVQRCMQTIYALCLRVGEAITLKYPGDTEANPTGIHLNVHKETYKPNLHSMVETHALRMVKLSETGKMPTIEEIAQIREPVAVFEAVLEKRKGIIKRTTALPLNPEYEPLAQPIYKYILKRQNKSEGVFPFYRQKIHKVAIKTFKGLSYTIIPYNVPLKDTEGNIIRIDTKVKTKFIQEHQRRLAVQGLRHVRASELRNIHGIQGRELDTFVGWVSSRRGDLGGQTQDRYAEQPWRAYFPKLLISCQNN